MPCQASHGTDLAAQLSRRDLLLASLTKFTDKPEDYRQWKAMFQIAAKDLSLPALEELCLMIRWLGPESATLAQNIHVACSDNYQEALRQAWNKLEMRYGAPTELSAALITKLQCFPTIGNTDFRKLWNLVDLLEELAAVKKDQRLSGLACLDQYQSQKDIIKKLRSKRGDRSFPLFFSLTKHPLQQQSAQNTDCCRGLDLQVEKNIEEKLFTENV